MRLLREDAAAAVEHLPPHSCHRTAASAEDVQPRHRCTQAFGLSFTTSKKSSPRPRHGRHGPPSDERSEAPLGAGLVLSRPPPVSLPCVPSARSGPRLGCPLHAGRGCRADAGQPPGLERGAARCRPAVGPRRVLPVPSPQAALLQTSPCQAGPLFRSRRYYQAHSIGKIAVIFKTSIHYPIQVHTYALRTRPSPSGRCAWSAAHCPLWAAAVASSAAAAAPEARACPERRGASRRAR